jgi:hypothetical protein
MDPRAARSIAQAAVAALAFAGACGQARADPASSVPTFVFWQMQERKVVEWKATTQLGLAAATGNSQAVSLSASASVSRRAGDNKLSAEVAAAFARSRVFLAEERNGIPGIGPDELRSVEQTTTQFWSVKTRYDRFLGRWNALYVQAALAADKPAGKELLAGGQVGYRRILLDLARQQVAAELGYDLTHQEYVVGAPNQIHSGRVFLGYRREPDPLLGFESSVELLSNLNAESTPTGRVGPFGDERLTGLLGVTLKLTDRGSLGLRFSARYTTAPAPRPLPGFTYEPGFLPLADRLDTKSELVLLWQLL